MNLMAAGKREMMISLRDTVTVALMLLGGACTTVASDTQPAMPTTITMVKQWSGDFPVAELRRLPAGQRETPAGVITDPETFQSVWQAFKPEDALPAIDFGHNLAIFVRNTVYYNRTRIAKVTQTDGIAEILTMETRTALPIEEKAAMAIAEIPGKGVHAIRTGQQLIPIQSDQNNDLATLGPLAENEQIVEGWVTIGHEVRAFRPCGQGEDLWILGNSPALGNIVKAYGKSAGGKIPYTPVFQVLAGRPTETPANGFGADYPGGYYVSRLVRVPSGQSASD
jgi:hypothetical protein